MNCNGKVTIQKKKTFATLFMTFGLPLCFSAFGFFQVFLAVSLTDKHS